MSRSERMRLFVAVYPDADLAQRCAAAAQSLTLPDHRPTPHEQIHLTLLFVGDVDARHLDEITESVHRSAAGLPAFTLTPQRLITLPERGPARLVALETDAPAPMLEFRSRLVRRLAHRTRARSNDRFRPHFTLARFNSPTAGVRVNEPIDLPPMSIAEVHLMASTLHPSGAVHRSLERIQFAAQ